MYKLTFALSILVLVLGGVACVPNLEPTATATLKPTPSPEPTHTPVPQDIVITGPGCPDAFQEDQPISKAVEIAAGRSLSLTLGSTPSVPCWWRSPESSDPAIVRQVDHQTTWPAEDVTPMPGAPGTETWVFETLQAGESTLSLECVCLEEEGAAEEVRGIFTLNVTVKE